VYKVDATGREAVLYSFTGGADGSHPNAGVIADAAGNLYGTTSGAAGNLGTVYKLDTAGQVTVLYRFSGGADGSQPYSGLIRDAAGNFYGTTLYGGTAGVGVVYKLDAASHQTVLYQ
ncbi:MAG: choice-of-anchor tandem repeat GloVer-containing protein, partial [Bryobacteraceae bacterium]